MDGKDTSNDLRYIYSHSTIAHERKERQSRQALEQRKKDNDDDMDWRETLSDQDEDDFVPHSSKSGRRRTTLTTSVTPKNRKPYFHKSAREEPVLTYLHDSHIHDKATVEAMESKFDSRPMPVHPLSYAQSLFMNGGSTGMSQQLSSAYFEKLLSGSSTHSPHFPHSVPASLWRNTSDASPQLSTSLGQMSVNSTFYHPSSSTSGSLRQALSERRL